MQELRPAVLGQAIANNRLDLLAAARYALNGAVGFALAAGRIEDHQLTHTRMVVMAANDRDDFAQMSRNRSRVEERIRPVRVATVVRLLLGAVGVHVKQQAGVRVGRVGVLPAGVEHATSVEHGWTPVMFLIETELADVCTIRIHHIQIRHMRRAVDAGNTHKRGRRCEDDLVTRQIAGVVTIHIGLLAGNLTQLRTIGADLEHLPVAVVAGHREQHPLGVEV